LKRERTTTRQAGRWRKYARRALLALVVVLCLAWATLSYVGTLNGNVRVVEPGRVYRSGQLVGPKLVDVLRSRHIRSVVNLRGHLPEDAKLRNEWAVCRRMDIEHVDISMSAGKLPWPTELRKLILALDKLPRPMLIHCAGGSDRTGLVCALYVNMYERVPLDDAQSDQLTWRYGHLRYGSAHPMDDFFALYRKTGKGMSIRRWALDRYPKVYAELMSRRNTARS